MATKLRLVETYTRKLEYDRAYLTLSEMLKDEVPEEILKPSSSAMVKLGDVDMEKGNLTESAMKYREALAADPAQLEGHIGLGEVELKRGNHESAGKHFDMAKNIALDVNEDDITMLNNIAIRHRRSGRPKEAVAILERSLQVAQGNPFLLYNLGRAYMDLDRMEMAVICFKDALKIAPGLAEAKKMLMVITGKDR
jgi:tetratricopeptide (TPR) repeat protein